MASWPDTQCCQSLPVPAADVSRLHRETAASIHHRKAVQVNETIYKILRRLSRRAVEETRGTCRRAYRPCRGCSRSRRGYVRIVQCRLDLRSKGRSFRLPTALIVSNEPQSPVSLSLLPSGLIAFLQTTPHFSLPQFSLAQKRNLSETELRLGLQTRVTH